MESENSGAESPPRPPRAGEPAEPPSPRIGAPAAFALIAAFALLIAVPPVHQFVVETDGGAAPAAWRFLRLAGQWPTAESLKQFETDLARESALAAAVRVPYQAATTAALGAGSQQVVVGRDGRLFHRIEADFCRGPGFLSAEFLRTKTAAHPDPLPAIAAFRDALAARGIRLLLVPVPVKPVVYPGHLWAGYPADAGPAWNRDRDEWNRRLAAAGVEVLDLTEAFRESRGDDLFLRTDTHWSPAGVDLAARLVADRIRPWLGSYESTDFAVGDAEATARGDLAELLELPEATPGFAPQTVRIRPVPDAVGGDGSPVLLLGDSYANIYTSADLNWGTDAGLGPQLGRRLGLPVQVIARNGGGATAVRQALAARPGALAAKRVVVWEFSLRDLYDPAVGWDPLPLPPPAEPAATPPAPAPAAGELVVIGELLGDPPTVRLTGRPYADAVVVYKFRVLRVEAGRYAEPEVLAAMPILTARKVQPPARFRRGAAYRLVLSERGPPGSDAWLTFDDTGEFALPRLWAGSATPH